MLLISTTKSLTSHVSYCAGMITIPAFACRGRFGDEPWLEEEVVDVDFASVIEDAVAGGEKIEGATVRPEANCGSGAVCDGTLGESDMSRRFPSDEIWTAGGGVEAKGGEYCVPTSIVPFFSAIDNDSVVECHARLLGTGALAGDREHCRGKAAAGGVLMSGCGAMVLGD